MAKPMEQPKHIYEDWSYMIQSGYEECLDLGWSKEAASGKTLSDVEYAERKGSSLERKVIHFHLCHLFAMVDVREAFDQVYEKLEKECEEDGTFRFYHEVEELNEFKEEMDTKEKIIREYAKK